MLITAQTDGRIERILIRPGTPVKADSVVMVMTSPELQNTLVTAEYALKAAQADYENLKVTLEKTLLDMQSVAAQVDADYNTAKLRSRPRHQRWPRKTCCRTWTRKISRGKGEATGRAGARSRRSGWPLTRRRKRRNWTRRRSRWSSCAPITT